MVIWWREYLFQFTVDESHAFKLWQYLLWRFFTVISVNVLVSLCAYYFQSEVVWWDRFEKLRKKDLWSYLCCCYFSAAVTVKVKVVSQSADGVFNVIMYLYTRSGNRVCLNDALVDQRYAVPLDHDGKLFEPTTSDRWHFCLATIPMRNVWQKEWYCSLQEMFLCHIKW